MNANIFILSKTMSF